MPLFSGELYMVWSFGGYLQVYTQKLCSYSNFETSPISAFGAMTHFGTKLCHFGTKLSQTTKAFNICKNNGMNMKFNENNYFDS